jgi:hypothetical protein
MGRLSLLNLMNSEAERASKLQQRYFDDRERKVRERERFLDHLAKRHSERLGLPLHAARQHVDAVAVSARKRDDPYSGL